jgi:hypothetical protein
MTVWIYTDTNKPEGVAFAYEVMAGNHTTAG